MPKQKNIKPLFTVKTGTKNEFFTEMKAIMRAADQGKKIKAEHTLIFENPAEMLHFLSETKIKLIDSIRKHPGLVSTIVKRTKRNRVAVWRDIRELEKFGLVSTWEEANSGHGRHILVKVAAPRFKLEAFI